METATRTTTHTADVTVDLCALRHLTESVICRAVEAALTKSPSVPEGIAAQVVDRNVTLTGQVDWTYQREAADQIVRSLPGVGSVENQITTVARTPLENAQERLNNARFRDPQIQPDHVVVTITGQTAVLTGYVRSLAEKRQAGLAAWIAPGVTAIENRLDIRPL
ncbi:BON domain-containing protein [Nesterenkonia aurantiaca]|uniref:BON domain-containing protein n=1 Tax=Nesterenkonia aurantiaca TaxID=1436010 RepID=UPI003EE7922A